MAVSVAKGSFVCSTSTGDQDVSVGFLPKGVIVWGTLQTAAGFAAHSRWFLGASDGTVHWCASGASDDNVGTTNAGRTWSETAVVTYLSDGTPTVDSVATVTFTGAVLRFNWSDAPGSAWIVHYLAFGGDDISCKALIKTTKSTNGSQAETGAGFQPKALLWALSGRTAAGTAAEMTTCMGFAGSPTTTVALGYEQSDADDTSVVSSFFESGTEFVMQNGQFGLAYQTSLTSFDADGWTADWTTTEGFGRKYGVLALGGAASFVSGVDTQPTAPTAKETALSITPAAVLFASAQTTADGLTTAACRNTIGATDGTTEGSIWAGSVDNVDTSEDDNASSVTKCLQFATNPSTVVAEADCALGANKFTLDWTTADASARRFGYLAIGASEPARPYASVTIGPAY